MYAERHLDDSGVLLDAVVDMWHDAACLVLDDPVRRDAGESWCSLLSGPLPTRDPYGLASGYGPGGG